MNTFSQNLLTVFVAMTMISLAGCGEEPKPASMTEGVPLSEIEAYEQQVLAMEAEDAGAMDEVDEGREPEAPAEAPAE